MRATVLDVNVILSSVIAPLGIPRLIVGAWLAERYEMITSVGIIAQVEEKLGLPRIARRYGVTPEVTLGTVALLGSRATVIAVPLEEHLPVTGDPEDDLVLATGRLASAGYLVTGNAGLLALAQYAGMQIVSPRAFLEILADEEHGQ